MVHLRHRQSCCPEEGHPREEGSDECYLDHYRSLTPCLPQNLSQTDSLPYFPVRRDLCRTLKCPVASSALLYSQCHSSPHGICTDGDTHAIKSGVQETITERNSAARERRMKTWYLHPNSWVPITEGCGVILGSKNPCEQIVQGERYPPSSIEGELEILSIMSSSRMSSPSPSANSPSSAETPPMLLL